MPSRFQKEAGAQFRPTVQSTWASRLRLKGGLGDLPCLHCVAHVLTNATQWPKSSCNTLSDARLCRERELRKMNTRENGRLSDPELFALFDQLFPEGLAGPDVLVEVAPEGWERSPLLACFHPSVERIFEEQLQFHRNVEELGKLLKRRGRSESLRAPPSNNEPRDEPTLEGVRREHQPRPVRQAEEVTELVGQCLWDVFSDNHDVIVADGRIGDIGSFRGASAFLDEYITRAVANTPRLHVRAGPSSGSDRGDHMRFYKGSIWISGRADLVPVYSMIFRRLQSMGADWIYHFPELGVVDLSQHKTEDESTAGYSPTRAVAAEREAQKRRAEVERLRAVLAEGNARAREEAMDRPPPATVRAYRAVFGQDPLGWPPA